MTDGRISRLKENVDKLLVDEIELGSFPGAAYAIGTGRELVLENALGYMVLQPAKMFASVDTWYDAASITKPLITGTLVLKAAEEGKIRLDDPVSKHLPELLETRDKKEVTFIDLLTHRGGFQAWYPLYAQGMGDQSYLRALLARPLRYRPATREIYSCLGFILLHLTLERIYGQPAEKLAAEKIFKPLGLRDSRFNPPPDQKYQIAATEWGNANERQMVAARELDFPHFRNYMIWGEVNDGNSYYMGGFAGNAGLFTTAREALKLAQVYTNLEFNVLTPASIAQALRNYTIGLEENRGLGWQLQSTSSNHPSSVLSERCFGHTGFTGTSVWCDPDRDLVMVLLTNRIHPSVRPLNMQRVRKRFHKTIAAVWDEG